MVHFLKRAFGASVRIEAVALSDARGMVTLRIPFDRMQQGCATIEEANVLDGEVSEIRVPRRRLDEYGMDRVAVIKIDVEGHELAVLKGAETLLARNRPTLIVEAEERHREGALESTRDYLSTWGYQGFFLRESRPRQLDEISTGPKLGHEAAKQGIYNFVFVARDNVIERIRSLH
jgi:FkbM family methyltransferase